MLTIFAIFNTLVGCPADGSPDGTPDGFHYEPCSKNRDSCSCDTSTYGENSLFAGLIKYRAFGKEIFQIFTAFSDPCYENGHKVLLEIVASANTWFAQSRNNQHLRFQIPTLEESTQFLDEFRAKMKR